MSPARFIEIDGKRHLRRDILWLRREQQKALAHAQQPALFLLKEDRGSESQRTAVGRLREPTLFAD